MFDLLVIALLLSLSFGVKKLTAYSDKYDSIYQTYAPSTGESWKLIKAIAIVESGQNHLAINTKEGYGRSSVGLMQILYPQTLYNYNLNNFAFYTKSDLYKPEVSVKIASDLIRDIKRRNTSKADIIASYNAGSPKYNSTGILINQDYVNKVLKTYAELL